MLLQGGENVAKKQTDGSLALEQQRVIVIPAHDEIVARKLRVAAYARVSSSSEDQLNSYRVQNQYYSELISSNPDWEMVDIYADEGITGTSVEKREDFQRMMQDCRKGKIDRILVKSISRFARNTKDCLAAVRELKELGVSVQFEEQGIDTSKMSSEMVTAIIASLAQKGSESISGNVQWGYQKRMESGKFNTCKAPYGFTLHEGKLSIIEDEAAVVRFIFQLYLNGLNGYEIANTLSQQEIPPGREMGTWKDSSIYYILKNERYAGNAVVGKSYSTTTFPHKKVRNHGEREMYLLPDSNPPIISSEVFDRVQTLLQSRKNAHIGSTNQPFSRKLYCANCGRSLKRKFTNDKMYWVCNTHFQNAASCPTPPYHTPDIEQAFCRMYYKLKHHGDPIFTQMLSNLQKIRYSRMLWSEDVISLNKKISDILSQVQFLAQLQQAGGVDPDSERQFHIEADYFIDATGDGTVSAKAGVPFSGGNGNHETLGNSILYYTRREDHPVSFIAPDYAYDMSHIEKILGCGGRIINERMSGSDCWWFEYGGLRDTISNAQDIALELRRLVLGVWNHVKNSGKFHADCYTLDWIGSIPGKRESRPWGGVNAWIAAPEDAEPWAELRWAAPACEIW